jgi:hypothetical protein
MLSRLDDYPIHQVPLPVAHPGSSDRNHYDRYFFNGYLPDGEVYFGGAMGLYPNRRVIDAAFSIISDGVQRNVYASGLAPVERSHTRVGPVRIEVVEPMERIRVVVEDNEHGVGADVTFEARAVAIEEDRQTRLAGNVLVMDVTRFTQSGTWSGWVESGGTRIDLDPAVARGTRDRSWGVRPVGEPPGGAPASSAPPQIFWLWAPLHFRDRCTYIALFGDADGNFWYQHALVAPVRTRAEDPTIDPGGIAELLRSVEVDIQWEKGTRRSRAASMVLHGFRGPDRRLTFEPIYTFQMCGIGYQHPTWAHGTWHGELAVGGDSWRLDEIDPMAPQNLHIQQLCRVTLDGEAGCGILEQIAIGPHHPSGLTGILDPYPG